MKAVKIILFSIFVLLACSIVGLVVFFRMFDLNAHVPQITEAVAKAVGRQVKIGRADLGFSFVRGFSVTVAGIVISDDPRFSAGPFLSVSKVALGVDLKEFVLKQKLVIADVLVDQLHVTIIRNKNGLMNVMTMGPGGQKEENASDARNSAGKPAGLPVFLIKDIKVTGADVTYVDEAVSPKMTVRIQKIDLGVRDFSMSDPFRTHLKLALFSDQQNVEADAKITLQLKNLGARINDLRGKADLAKMSQAYITDAVPALKPLGLQTLKGVVTLDVESAAMNVLGLTSLKAKLGLEKGYLLTSLAPVGIDDMGVKITLDEKNAQIGDLFVSVAGGAIKGRGTVQKFLSAPDVLLTFDIVGIDTARISEAYKSPLQMNGLVQGAGKVSFSGKTPEEILKSLQVEVKTDLKAGTLQGLNLLQAGLAKVPLLSGIWQSIVADFPADTQEDLKKGVTVISRAGVDVHIQAMDLVLERAELVTRDVVFSASGTANLLSAVDIKGNLLVSSPISDVCIGKISDLSALRTQEGRIRIPVLVDGKVQAPRVHLDEQYLAKEVLMARGKKELEKVAGKNPGVAGVLNALFGGNSPDGASTESADDGAAGSSEEGQSAAGQDAGASQAAGALFNAIFRKD